MSHIPFFHPSSIVYTAAARKRCRLDRTSVPPSEFKKGCRQKRRSSVLEVEADDGPLITSKRRNTNGTSTGFADGSCKRSTSLRTSRRRGCRRNHSGPHSALREPQIVSGPDGLSTRTARPDHERT